MRKPIFVRIARWAAAVAAAAACAMPPLTASAEDQAEGGAPSVGAIANDGFRRSGRLELYGAGGYATETGDIHGANGSSVFGLGLNSWFPSRRPAWGGYLGVDLAWFSPARPRSGTQFPFDASRDLNALRDTVSINVCGLMDQPAFVCFGIGYALYDLAQGSDYEQTYGAAVWSLAVKAPLAERWLLGLSTDWSVISQKVAGAGSAAEFWRSSATLGYLF